MKEYPYWWDTVASPGPDRRTDTPPPSAVPPRADVAIVGAGYTGLSAARTLARAGASVVVIEQHAVGWGASSRNGGQALTGLKVEPATLVARHGEHRAAQLFEISKAAGSRLAAMIADEKIDCDYERTGHVLAAWKPKHFEAFREEQALLARVFNHRVELVDSRSQRSELGSDAYHGLMIDEASAGLNPARYVHGLAAAAERAGVTIAPHTAVTRLEKRGSRWSVATAGGDVDAGDVLVATDGYSGRAFPPLQRRLVPIGSYVVVTEPLGDDMARSILPKRRMAFDSKFFLYYFRLTADRRLLFGGRAEFGTPTPDTARRAAGILRDGMTTLFPELAGVGITHAWGGSVAFTRDEMPRAGRLDGAFYAGGYCGHGVAMATYLGELVARRMAGEQIEHPLFDDHFAAIPLYHGKPWFLPLVGAYYAFKDWIQ